jgi:hypothetical protein
MGPDVVVVAGIKRPIGRRRASPEMITLSIHSLCIEPVNRSTYVLCRANLGLGPIPDAQAVQTSLQERPIDAITVSHE